MPGWIFIIQMYPCFSKSKHLSSLIFMKAQPQDMLFYFLIPATPFTETPLWIHFSVIRSQYKINKSQKAKRLIAVNMSLCLFHVWRRYSDSIFHSYSTCADLHVKGILSNRSNWELRRSVLYQKLVYLVMYIVYLPKSFPNKRYYYYYYIIISIIL